VFLRATTDDDFVGVQCYTRMHFGPEVWPRTTPRCPHPDGGRALAPGDRAHVRRAASVSGRPVVVTRTASPTDDDAERIAFVRDALESAHRCIEEGIDLRGYFVWSLLDNFEWHMGYGPKFGIVAVTPDTFERRPKPSAFWFGEVARANAVGPASRPGTWSTHHTPIVTAAGIHQPPRLRWRRAVRAYKPFTPGFTRTKGARSSLHDGLWSFRRGLGHRHRPGLRGLSTYGRKYREHHLGNIVATFPPTG